MRLLISIKWCSRRRYFWNIHTLFSCLAALIFTTERTNIGQDKREHRQRNTFCDATLTAVIDACNVATWHWTVKVIRSNECHIVIILSARLTPYYCFRHATSCWRQLRRLATYVKHVLKQNLSDLLHNFCIPDMLEEISPIFKPICYHVYLCTCKLCILYNVMKSTTWR